MKIILQNTSMVFKQAVTFPYIDMDVKSSATTTSGANLVSGHIYVIYFQSVPVTSGQIDFRQSGASKANFRLSFATTVYPCCVKFTASADGEFVIKGTSNIGSMRFYIIDVTSNTKSTQSVTNGTSGTSTGITLGSGKYALIFSNASPQPSGTCNIEYGDGTNTFKYNLDFSISVNTGFVLEGNKSLVFGNSTNLDNVTYDVEIIQLY